MSILSSIWEFLSVAQLPSVALAFIDNQAVLLKLKKRRNQFYVERVAGVFLPKALLRPDFSISNISDINSLAISIKQAITNSGLKGHKRWSVALPEEVARSLVVTLDTKPEGQEELKQMLSWKVERIVGVPTTQLRVVHQQIPSTGLPRYLVTVVSEAIIREYETLFEQLGWHAGVIMPRHICEASWLMRNKIIGDKLLVSHNSWGFSSVALREEEPLMVRLRECGEEDLESELYRLATYYQEKVMLATSNTPLNLLVIGDPAQTELTARTFADALTDVKFNVIKTTDFSLNISDPNYQFSQVAAAAGLAAMAYS
jgi:Tfp pilus assembly PilM family ATPase